MRVKTIQLILPNLAITTAVVSFENKTPNVSNLVKNIDYITNISKTEKQISDHEHDKYLTTPEFDNLNEENFAARLEQVNLASKNNIAALYKKTQILLIN